MGRGREAESRAQSGIIKHPEGKQHLCEGTLGRKRQTGSVWTNVPVISGRSNHLENYENKSKEVKISIVFSF